MLAINKTRPHLFLVCLLFCIPALCRADAGWTGYGHIVDLAVSEKARIVVEVEVPDNDTDCKNKTMFFHEHHGKGSDYILQLLLVAVAENKKVRVYQTSVCDLSNYSYLTSVGILP